jgi:hypothetical protein
MLGWQIKLESISSITIILYTEQKIAEIVLIECSIETIIWFGEVAHNIDQMKFPYAFSLYLLA